MREKMALDNKKPAKHLTIKRDARLTNMKTILERVNYDSTSQIHQYVI